jgi:hypothetical protein
MVWKFCCLIFVVPITLCNFKKEAMQNYCWKNEKMFCVVYEDDANNWASNYVE